MVQRRVEGVLLRRSATLDGDAPEEGVPAIVRLRADLLYRPARVLRPEVLHGVLCADEGDADLHEHLPLFGRVEGHERTTRDAGAVAFPGEDTRIPPCPRRRERPVEERDEVHRVVGAGPAELPARHLALDLVAADDVHACRSDGVDAARHLEQHVGFGSRWEGEARDPGPCGDGQRHGDRRLLTEHDLIATGRGVLFLVREGGDCRRRRGDGALGGQYRDVLVRRASRPTQVGQTEAAYVGVVVGVAPARLHCVRAGVRAPLDHAEGNVRSGELADSARGHGSGPRAVERMDEGRRVGVGGRARWGPRGRKRNAASDSCGQGAEHGERCRGHHGSASPAGADHGGHRDDRSNGNCGATGRRGCGGADAGAGSIRGRVTARCHARRRGCMADRRVARARFRDDGDRPLQRRPGVLRAGVGGGGRRGQELVRPHRPRP